MSMETRGGVPRVRSYTIDTTGDRYNIEPPMVTKHLRLSNLSSDPLEIVRVYFREDDYDNDEHYVSLLPGVPFSEPVELTHLWLKAESGTPVVEVIGFARR